MDSSPPPETGWIRQAGVRACQWWPSKILGTTLDLTGFFVLYFWVLNHPLRLVTLVPLTAVDQWVGFWPGALPLYLSLWLYVSLAPALLVVRRELVSYGLATMGLSLVGLGLFYVWPTTVPRPDIDWSQHPGLVFLKSADASGNACPSLQVAFAVFTAIWLGRLLPQPGAGRLIRLFTDRKLDYRITQNSGDGVYTAPANRPDPAGSSCRRKRHQDSHPLASLVVISALREGRPCSISQYLRSREPAFRVLSAFHQTALCMCSGCS